LEAAKVLDSFNGGNMYDQLTKEILEMEITPTQQALLNGFYSGRREAIERNRIPHATLERIAAKIHYETDLAISVMQQLDDHLLGLIAERDKREMDKVKAGRR